MIIILKDHAPQAKLDQLLLELKAKGLDTHPIVGEHQTIIGLIGNTTRIDTGALEQHDIVAAVRRVSEPFKLVNRQFHGEDDTIVSVPGAKVGGVHFGVIAGPCSIESEEQIITAALRAKAAGANILRGGAFKPRTSPYAFRGLKGEGLRLLLEAKKASGLPIVTELTSLENIDLFADVDIIQVGARNMQNFDMLWELGKCNKPILLKRGLSATIQELLMSAEYIAAGGNENIILCERGIRTFETATRNTMDISAVPVLHHLTHLPVIVDPSHATGHYELIAPMALAATAAGADGLMIEVHNDPNNALCDGPQSLKASGFVSLMEKVNAIRPYAYRSHLSDSDGK